MSTTVISRRYAQALFELSQEGAPASLESGLQQLAAAVGTSEVAAVLSNPEINGQVKEQIIAKVVPGLTAELTRLAALLIKRSKIALLPEIAAIFDALKRDAAAEAVVAVTFAQEASASLQQSLAQAVSGATGKKVRLEVGSDASLIGGAVIRIGDRQIDLSVRGKLENLRRALAA